MKPKFLLLSSCLLCLASSQTVAQTQFGTMNRDNTVIASVIDREAAIPVYANKVFYYNDAGGPSRIFPDYGTQEFSLGHCSIGRKYMKWSVKYSSTGLGSIPLATFTYSPSNTSDNISVSIIAHNDRRTQCWGGGEAHEDNTVASFTITVEQFQWPEIPELKSVCTSMDMDYNLVDVFPVKNGVSFYLDDAGGSAITTINPKKLTPGFHKLIAAKQYDNGAVDANYGSRQAIVFTEFSFQVLAAPDITIKTAPTAICQNGNPFTLVASPTGGTWSGKGIDEAGNVSPQGTALGANTYTYKITAANGCVSSNNISITAWPEPELAAANIAACNGAAPFVLTTGIPAGGTYSGRGVVAGKNFDPSLALVGDNTIIYSYTDPKTSCTSSTSFKVEVLDAGGFSAGDDFTTCNTAANINLNELPGVSPADGTITWSGKGVVNGKYFSPKASGVGLFELTATLKVPTTGCTYVKTIAANVVAGPTVTAGENMEICGNEPDLRIPGGTPVGGNWSGEDIDGNMFRVSSAPAGQYLATYTVTTPSCVVITSKIITVRQPPVVSAGADFSVCASGGTIALPPGTPAGGVWTGGDFVDGIYIHPYMMPTGSSMISYVVKDDICTASDDLVVSTIPVPAIMVTGRDSACISASPFIPSAQPEGGYWSGLGVNDGLFDPLEAGLGPHDLVYVYTDQSTGCSGVGYSTITVTAPPIVDAGPAITICDNAPAIKLQGATPAGGAWSGPYVTADGHFPSQHLVRGDYSALYTYSDGICSAVGQRTFHIKPSPVVSAGPDLQICNNIPALTLSQATPSGGTWKAIGGDFFDENNTLVPARLAIGTNTAAYTYAEGGCTGTDEILLIGLAAPVITVMNDFSVCRNGAAVNLQGTPAGGTWDGPGVSRNQGNFFVPQDAGAGTFALSYSYLDQASGCSSVGPVTAKVLEPPVVKMPPDTAICIDTKKLQLLPLPTGGVWTTASGLQNNELDLVAAGAGAHQYSYSYQDPGTRCATTEYVSVSIQPSAGLISVSGDTAACMGNIVQLKAAAENIPSFSWYKASEEKPFANGIAASMKISSDQEIIKIVPATSQPGGCTTAPVSFRLRSLTPVGGISLVTPLDTVSFGTLVQLSSDVKPADTFQWIFSDGGSSAQASPSYYCYHPGVLGVKLVASNEFGCLDSFFLSKHLVVLAENGSAVPPVFTRGDGVDASAADIKVYPTTFSGKLTTEVWLGQAQPLQLKLLDFSGNTVLQQKVPGAKGSNLVNLSTGNLGSPGNFYFLQVCYPDLPTCAVFKLVKL